MGIRWRACAAAIRAARVVVMAGSRARVVVVVANMCKPSFYVDFCGGCAAAARVLPAPGWRGVPRHYYSMTVRRLQYISCCFVGEICIFNNNMGGAKNYYGTTIHAGSP